MMKRQVCYFLLAGVLCAGTGRAATPSTINTTNKWAWSSSAGWINCRTDSTNGAVIGPYVCSGYLYSPVSGWIYLGNGQPTNGIRYVNGGTNDYGVNNDGTGHLRGFAWCPSSGWISFEWTNAEAADAPKINLQSGVMSGFAWSASLGWISLTNLSAYCKTDRFAPQADANANGVPDAWELETVGSTNLLSATKDSDNDGLTDYEEYVADTDPTNSASVFAFTSASNGTTNVTLRWPTSSSRLYKVEHRTDFLSPTGWVDSGLVITTNASTASVTLPSNVSTHTFYRVRAILPLSP